jgi:hypothetical protein
VSRLAGPPFSGAEVSAVRGRQSTVDPVRGPQNGMMTTTAGTRWKVGQGALEPGRPVRAGDGRIRRIQNYARARELLRHAEKRRAGFGIEGLIVEVSG